MKVEIIGAESLGVRGLCCFVTVGEQKILIAPGIALGFLRRGQAPRLIHHIEKKTKGSFFQILSMYKVIPNDKDY